MPLCLSLNGCFFSIFSQCLSASFSVLHLFQCLSVCLYLSVSVCLSLSVCLYLSLSVSVCLCQSLSVVSGSKTKDQARGQTHKQYNPRECCLSRKTVAGVTKRFEATRNEAKLRRRFFGPDSGSSFSTVSWIQKCKKQKQQHK